MYMCMHMLSCVCETHELQKSGRARAAPRFPVAYKAAKYRLGLRLQSQSEKCDLESNLATRLLVLN